jgi:hypothetical protein
MLQPDTRLSYETFTGLNTMLRHALSRQRIYFAHQSVGLDIIHGTESILQATPETRLAIVETRNPIDITGAVLAHTRIGKNYDPLSKIADFVATLNSGVGECVDIAFMKLCYVDITYDTDIEPILDAYRSAMERLKGNFPQTAFLHVTVPLNSQRANIRVKLRHLFGKTSPIFLANQRRNRFNELLIKEYSGIDPIFDLATIESTQPSGRRETSTIQGQTIYSLYPGYTHDGGHLNQHGRQIVADRLLGTLARIANRIN